MVRMGAIAQANIDSAITTHAAIATSHHTKTVNAGQLSAGTLLSARLAANQKYAELIFIIDGGGSAIEAGNKGHLEVPFACTITGWTLAADQSGAIKIDVWRDTYANFPPANGDSLCNSHEPEIAASGDNAQDLDLADWTSVALVAGDWLAFYVDSCATITRVTLSLRVTKT